MVIKNQLIFKKKINQLTGIRFVLASMIFVYHYRDLLFNNNVERATTGDAMGSPLNALAWLANLLADQGRPLKKGNIVMSGSTLATKFAARGDHAIYSIDGVGSVEVRIN